MSMTHNAWPAGDALGRAFSASSSIAFQQQGWPAWAELTPERQTECRQKAIQCVEHYERRDQSAITHQKPGMMRHCCATCDALR